MSPANMYAKLLPCAGGCGTLHSAHEIACEYCWELVPAPLRQAYVSAKIGQPWGASKTVPDERAITVEIVEWLETL